MGSDVWGKYENPKDIGEWFHNRDIDNDIDNIDTGISKGIAMLKELYKDKIDDLVYKDNPFLAKIDKTEEK